MGFRFHIDGTQEFGYSPINRFEYSFHLFMNTVKRVCNLYPCASVLNLKGYVAHFCYIRLVSFDTLVKVVVEHKDFVTANCILRMLGDCVAVFRLIYCEPDKDMLLLRHALYVIDGCERNLKVLTEDNINEGLLPVDELEDSNNTVKYNREHRQRLMREAQQIIDNSPLKAENKDVFDKIVDDRNWKFKEFKDYKKTKSNQYQWADLYKLIGCCEDFDLLSYISQYAHGLSMSNLIIKMDEKNMNGIMSEAVGLIDRLHEYALDFFESDYMYIMEGLLVPETRDKIRTYFDDEHRPDAASWDMAVINKIKEVSAMASSQYN